MSEAITIIEAYKKFGSPVPPVNMRIPGLYGRSSAKTHALPAQPTLIVAVDHVSLSVQPGEIFGVLGPTGSGKSTLLRLVAGLLSPDGGTIRVGGYDVNRQTSHAQRLTNRAAIEASFLRKRSAVENLMAGARQAGLDGRSARERIIELLTRLGLDGQAIHAPLEAVSRSVQQKAALARSLLSRPRVLLLDEPTAGMDRQSRCEIHAVLQALRAELGMTIFFTTQDVEEAETLGDVSVEMFAGQIKAQCAPAPLRLARPAAAGPFDPALGAALLAWTSRRMVPKTAPA